MNKINAYFTGLSGACTMVLGIIFLLAPKGVCITIASIALCLILALGIMIPNPFSILLLIAGICMLVLPPLAVGIFLVALGITIALLNIPTKTGVLK